MIADLAVGLFIVTIIYILVRPSSQGVVFVQAFTTAMTAIVSTAADLASTTGGDAAQDGNDQ